MMYLCRQLHFTEVNEDASMEIFCKGCNKAIRKCELYRFQNIRKAWYLRQNSKPWVRNSFRLKRNESQRKWYRRKKAEKLGLVQNGQQ